jgi:hypothetical protein
MTALAATNRSTGSDSHLDECTCIVYGLYSFFRLAKSSRVRAMITTTLDPISLNDVTDIDSAPYLI